MLFRGLSVSALLWVLAATASASVTPMIDGTVNPGEYSFILNDTPTETGMTFYNTGLDISTLQFARDPSWNYMALTVVNPPLTMGGGPTSLLHETDFWTIFSDATGTTPLYYLDVRMNSAGVESVSLEHNNGGTWQAISMIPGVDYVVGAAASLEIKVSAAKMPDLPSVFQAGSQLDDTGAWPDDQIRGLVPEPMTLGLTGLGVAGLWMQRRTASMRRA
jgi:hypothetical protein